MDGSFCLSVPTHGFSGERGGVCVPRCGPLGGCCGIKYIVYVDVELTASAI